MSKAALKERLNELTKQIRSNSKDVHFTEKLVEELLSVKGQMMIEPIELDCGKKVKEYSGETYRITLTNKGILYHEYGGYSIFVTPNNRSLYMMLESLIDREDISTMTKEDRDRMETAHSAIAYCLMIPKIVFSDAEFTFDMASKVIEYIKKLYDKSIEADLQEETVKEDAEFKEATLGLEELKKNAL